MDLPFPLISEVVKLYNQTKQTADINLDAVDRPVLVGFQSRKNAAIQELEVIARKLRELVEQDSAAIIPVGPREHQESYAAVAEDEGNAIVVEANSLYEELARLVEPFLGPGRTFTTDTARALHQALVQVGTKLKLLSVVMPHITQTLGSVLPTRQDLVAALKPLVRAANTDDLAAIYLSHQVFEKVLAAEYEQNAVPVVVLGATEDEAKGDFAIRLFGGRTIAVDVSNPPERNDIVVGFRTLKPLFKRSAAVQVARNAHIARAAKAQKAASPDAAPTTAEQATTNGTN